MQFVSPGSPQRSERSSEPIGRRASLPTAVFLVLLLSSPAIAQTFPSIFFSLDSSGRTILIDQTQEGALTTHDPITEDGRPIQVWQLDTRVGRPLQVTVESPDFDTLLTVVGPGIDQPLHNDDRPDDTNSTICFVPSMDGEYRAVVSSYEPRSVGSFLLSSTSVDGECEQAASTYPIGPLPSLSSSDDSVLAQTILESFANIPSLLSPNEGRLLTVGDEHHGFLTDSDTFFDLLPLQAWRFDGTAGERLSIDLLSDDFDSQLFLIGPLRSATDLSGIVFYEDDDGAGGCNSRITLEFPKTGTYLAFVSALDALVGRFTIVASREPLPVDPHDCTPPSLFLPDLQEIPVGELQDIPVIGTLPPDQAVLGTIRGNEPTVQYTPMQRWTAEGTKGDHVAILLTSAQFDTFLLLNGPGFAKVLTNDDGFADTDSLICAVLPETGSYSVFVAPYWRDELRAGHQYRVTAAIRSATSLCDVFDDPTIPESPESK